MEIYDLYVWVLFRAQYCEKGVQHVALSVISTVFVCRGRGVLSPVQGQASVLNYSQ